MNKKDMKRSGWARCVQKGYIAKACTLNGVCGVESLTLLQKLTAPLTIHYDFGDVLIADAGYAWLQIALENQFFWLTAMYNERGDLIQLYFDITAGNELSDPDNPCFTDMYLDIVVTASGEIHILDQDELEDALASGAITSAEYAHARSVCQELYDYLSANKANVTLLCNDLFHALKMALHEGAM